MFIKLTDKRSITKQIISGICWSPVAVLCLCVAAILGLMAYGIVFIICTGGIIKVIILIAKGAFTMALIFGYLIAFVWSNQNSEEVMLNGRKEETRDSDGKDERNGEEKGRR